MRLGALAAVIVPCALALACDAGISPADLRHGASERVNWLVELHAPGRVETSREREFNGPALHLRVTGPPGLYRASASISGTSCEGEPRIDVRSGKSVLAQWVIAPGGALATYHAPLALGTEPRRLDFLFTNDFATRECDRNVTFRGVQVDLPPPGEGP